MKNILNLNKVISLIKFYLVKRSIVTMQKRIRLGFYHALYVGGMTFFSSLGTKFLDETLTVPEIKYCFIATFIAMGLAFFSSVNLQRMNGCYKEEPSKKRYCYLEEQKRIKGLRTNNYVKGFKWTMSKHVEKISDSHKRILNNVLVVTHSHTNLHKNGCIL